MQIKGYALYTYISNPDTEYDPCWTTTIVCDKEERDRVNEACGVKFTKCDGSPWEDFGEYKIVLRRYVEGRGKAKGKTNNAPKMFDKEGNLMEDTILGNGSKVVVQFKPYSWTYKKSKGVSGDLQWLKVFEVVEYVQPEAPEDEAEDDDAPSEGDQDVGDIQW